MSSSAGSSKPIGKLPIALIINLKMPLKGSDTNTLMVDTPIAIPPDELGDLEYDFNADDVKCLCCKLNKV